MPISKLVSKCRNLVGLLRRIKFLVGWQILITPALLTRKSLELSGISNQEPDKALKTKSVVVFSVISPSNEPLSYVSKRSVFTDQERLQQTRETLVSISNWDPEPEVVLLELSPFEWEETIPHIALAKQNRLVQLASLSPFKGLGQALAFCSYYRMDPRPREELWWVSGRYQIVKSSRSDHTASTEPTNNPGVIANYSGGLLATTFVGFRGGETIDSLASFLWSSRWRLLLNESLESVVTDFAAKRASVIPRRDRIQGRVAVSGEYVNQ